MSFFVFSSPAPRISLNSLSALIHSLILLDLRPFLTIPPPPSSLNPFLPFNSYPHPIFSFRSNPRIPHLPLLLAPMPPNSGSSGLSSRHSHRGIPDSPIHRYFPTKGSTRTSPSCSRRCLDYCKPPTSSYPSRLALSS